MQKLSLEGCSRLCQVSGFAIAILCSLAGCSQNESTTAEYIEYIVFASNRTATGNLYIMNPDGTGVKMITTVEGFKKEPCLSYDGFIVYQTGSRSIRRIDMDGNNDVSLNAYGTGAEWSPDGKHIVLTDNDWDILLMNRDGENILNLTASPDSTDHSPTWSPDGKRLLFMRTYVVSYSDTGNPQEYQSDLCVLDLESGNVTHLTTGPEYDMCPSWKRVQKPPDSGSPIVGY